MEIKEIDGKKFVLYEQDKEIKKKFLVSVIFLMIMAIAVVALAITTITLIDSKELIGKDPIKYGMDVHGFISCQCFDEGGVQWYSTGEGFVSQQLAGYGGVPIGSG